MTVNFLEYLHSQGVKTYPARRIPINWVNFRLHPDPNWEIVETLRNLIRNNQEIDPIIICSKCYVILDGWHRCAAHWLENKRYIEVIPAEQHWMMGKERCAVATPIIETIRNHFEMDCVSGAYHEKDWDNPAFQQIAAELTTLMNKHQRAMPKMRFWEAIKAVAFLGHVKNKKILDIGTRDSVVPAYLASKGAIVTCVDLDTSQIITGDNIEVYQADARELPFPDETFDHVIATAMVKWVPGWGDKKAVTEMLRVVKKDGTVGLTFDYGKEYEPYPSDTSGRRIYDQKTALKRLGLAEVVGPQDWDVDWNAPMETWPIRSQAPSVWQKGINLQVGYILLRKA